MGETSSLGEAVLDLSADPKKLKKDIASAKTESLKSLKGLQAGFTKWGQGLTKQIGGIMKTFGKIVAVGIAGATAAIVGFGTKGVKEFLKFQDGMNEVFTLLPDISEDAMTKMEGQVKDLSIEIGRLPEEIIPALYQSLSAGVPQDNVFDFLETAHMAALGGVTDIETAVDGLSSVVNSYKSVGISAAEVSDIMFTGVRLGKTTFGELSASLANVTPLASALNVSFGDVTAALAAMTAQGTDTSTATTQIRSLIQEMGTSGTEASKIFEDFTGGTLKDFMDAGGNFAEALGALEQASAEAGKPINELFGNVRAGLGALQLTGPGMETFIDVIGEMEGSAGATEKAYERMNSGMKRTFEQIQSAGKVALINIGDGLSKGLQPLAKMFLEWIKNIQPKVTVFFERLGKWLGETIPKVIAWFSKVWTLLWPKVVAAAKPFVDFIGMMITWFQEKLPIAIQFVTDHWEEFKGALIAIGAVLAGAGIIAAIASIASTLSILISPIGLIIAAAALLGAAWNGNWFGIRDTLTEVWENTIRPALETLWTWLQENVPKAIETLKTFWEETLLPAMENVWNWVQENLVPLWETLVEWLEENVPKALEVLADFWENTLLPAIESVYNWWNETLWPFLEEFGNFIEVTFIAILLILKKAWEEDVLPALEAVWEFLSVDLMPIWETLGGAISSFLEGAWAALTSGLETVTGWLETAVGWVWNLIDALNGVDTSNLDDITEHSPVPLAEGLKAISKAAPAAIAAINDIGSAADNFRMDLGVRGSAIYNAGGLPDVQRPSYEQAIQQTFQIQNEMTDIQIERLARRVVRYINR